MQAEKKKPVSKADAAENWGVDLAIIQQDKNLLDFFNKQYAKYAKSPAGFSESAFLRELRDQPFWQAHSEAYITDKQFELQYPEQYRVAVQADVDELRDVANAMGAAVDDDVLRQIAVKKRQGAYNQAQLNNVLASYLTVEQGRFAGKAGSAQDSLKQWAIKNGLGLSDDAIRGYVQKVMAGDQTEDDVKNDLRRTYLVGAYPAWADKIEAGYDPSDLFSPYLKTAQDLLEDTSLTLDDPLVKRLTQGTDANGKPVTVPLYEAEQMVRKDPRWQRTQNAYATYNRIGDDILKTFGFR